MLCCVLCCGVHARAAGACTQPPLPQTPPTTHNNTQTNQLELERKLRALLTKEKEKAEEEAALAMGLCRGGAMLP